MKQDLRCTDTETSSKVYNIPLIIEGVCEGRFYFSKIYSLFNSDRANDNIDLLECLLVSKVNGKWTIRLSSAAFTEREREREREDTMMGKGMHLGVRSMPFPIIVT